MPMPIVQLQGTVTATNALVVTGDDGDEFGGTPAPIANLQGTVDSSNRLLVRFV